LFIHLPHRLTPARRVGEDVARWRLKRFSSPGYARNRHADGSVAARIRDLADWRCMPLTLSFEVLQVGGDCEHRYQEALNKVP
jgi:hypothetical protein